MRHIRPSIISTVAAAILDGRGAGAVRKVGSNASNTRRHPGRVLPGGDKKPERKHRMELIALAVVFALGFVPLFLASELAAGHPGLERQAFRPSMDAATAARRYLATHPLGPRRPLVAANDEHEREAA